MDSNSYLFSGIHLATKNSMVLSSDRGQMLVLNSESLKLEMQVN